MVTTLLAHSAFSQQMIKECFIEKIHKRTFWNTFKKYNEEFLEKLIVNLASRAHEINLRGVF